MTSIDEYVRRYLARTHLPGAAIVVTRGNTIILSRGYGIDGQKTPVTTRTLMPIASLSKSFTSLAVMQLVESGKIALDSAASRYLPEFAIDDPRGRTITIRQLLEHTSGMSDMTFREKSLPQPTTLAGAMVRLRRATLADAPGTAGHYHNPNYQVAARLVEVVSGESFNAYLQRHIFAPLGMTSSSTVASTTGVRGLAKGHAIFYGRTVAVEEPYWFLDGSSGVITTADDMAKWLMYHATGSRASEISSGESTQPKLISRSALAELHGRSDAKGARPLGWAPREGNDVFPNHFFHAGWLFTASASQIILADSAIGIAVMTNRGIGLGGDDADQMAQGIVSILSGSEPSFPFPTGLVATVVFALLTLGTILLAYRAFVRARRWAEKRSGRTMVRNIVAMEPAAMWILLFAFFPSCVGRLAGGRDASWTHFFYMASPVVVWLATTALAGLMTIAVRSWHLARLRTAAR